MLLRQNAPLYADPTRVIARPFIPFDPARAARIVERALALPEAEIERVAADIAARYGHRHRDFDAIVERHARLVEEHLPEGTRPSAARRFVIGATFTHEYSIEAAALFNPSIVPHPDQSGAAEGELRVVVSFRATGEGHISSLTFRGATVCADGALRYDAPEPWATLPETDEAGIARFAPGTPLGERVLFPATPDERMGIEDARWVRFVEEDGRAMWVGTYTAYDGAAILPKLLATDDFATFRPLPLAGAAVRNKGFALFPRRVGGRYAMLGRQDNEQNYVMFSEEIQRWEEAIPLRSLAPARELVQVGNNGSPIETEAGWLILTHGVGPMREYTLGASLLDLDDPTRLIATYPGALLAPTEAEREGYVPNVVYTCGALVHNGWLVVPYAHSDAACDVAKVRVEELLARMEKVRSP